MTIMLEEANDNTTRFSFNLPGLLLILFVGLLTGCAGMDSLTSNNLERTITIDGVEKDWRGALRSVEKEDFTVGLLNDEDFLYISFITSSAELHGQIVTQGLVVWFDREGGKDKDFGIRYPLGLMAPTSDVNPEILKQDPSLVERYFNESLEHFELYEGNEKIGTKYTRSELKDLELKASLLNGSFVYELKIPISGDERYMLNPIVPGQIGVGFESPEIDLEMYQDTMLGQASERGMRGMGGSRIYFGQPTGSASRLKYWATLTLADSR